MIVFCLSRTVSGDCTRLLFGLLNRLHDQGHAVSALSFGSRPSWIECRAPFRQVESFAEGLAGCQFDIVVVSNPQLIPMVLTHANGRPVVFLCQGYESYYFGRTLSELRSDKPALQRVQQLPVEILACSRSVQRLLKQRVGRDSHYLPVAIEPAAEQADAPPGPPFRVLLAGAPEAPYKGMADAFAALERVNYEVPLQLVLLSPQTRPTPLPQYSAPTEVHYRASPAQSARVLASCHAYCNSSWYEGHDLTTLEAFSAGVPVVSTSNLWIDDLARPEENVLLVEPGQPDPFARALQRLLLHSALTDRLRRGGQAAVAGQWAWSTTVNEFLRAVEAFRARSSQPSVAPERMQSCLEALERDGLHTPLPVYRLLQRCERELEQATDSEAVRAVRRQLKTMLGYPQSQYYEAARALYDRCGLRLAWPDRRP